jgi:broad specificity phosphatase PhoE
MRRLILVKHAMPQIAPDRPARSWSLSVAGRASCSELADRLRAFDPARLVASHEPKAAETAQLAAQALGVAWEQADGLHEHDRVGVEWMGDGAFQDALKLFFRQPDDLVFGLETARQAEQRFVAALERVRELHPSGNLAVVAHGTVITLFVGRYNAIDRYDFWRRLGLPAIVALNEPDMQLAAVVESMAHS